MDFHLNNELEKTPNYKEKLTRKLNDQAKPEEQTPEAPEKKAAEPPRLLRRTLPPPKPYSLDALGDLAPVAERLAEVIKAPVALCGQSVLGAAALAVQGHADIVIDGRIVPLCENLLTIAESGERKTATDREALQEHRAREKALNDGYAKSWIKYDNDLTAHKKAKEDALKEAKTLEAKTAALEKLVLQRDFDFLRMRGASLSVAS
jgi:hypothetical protein